MAGAQQEVDVRSLSLDQLRNLREALEQELSYIQEQGRKLQSLTQHFVVAGKSLEDLGQQKVGKAVLVPLTSSLYVPARLSSNDSVLVDVGTGYYVEKDLPSGKDYCDRKIKFLKEKLDQLIPVIKQKQQEVEEVTSLLQARLQAAAQSRPPE